MAVRDKLNRNPALVFGAVILVILIAGYVIFRQVKDLTPKTEDQSFYTVDDGKTWFLDDITKIPPFDKDGKEAVRAHVYTCKGVKEPFVGYMQRITPTAKKQLEDLRAATKSATPNPNDMMKMQSIYMNGTEYKKPGDKDWVKGSVAVSCPSGNSADLERVIPGQ